MDCSPPGSSVQAIFQARILELGCHFLLQGIFPTQGWNMCLLHWKAHSLPLHHLGWSKMHLCVCVCMCVCVCVCVCVYTESLSSVESLSRVSSVESLSHVQLFATPWTAAHQALLSMKFPRQEYWSCHFLLQGIFLAQGLNLHLLCLLHCRQILYH